MASRMAERMGDLGARARERMTETRLDKMDRENDRLKHEVRLLREDLHEERGSLQRALDALGRNEHVTVETKVPKRRGRIVRTLVIGGGAYLLGDPCRPGALRPDRGEAPLDEVLRGGWAGFERRPGSVAVVEP